VRKILLYATQIWLKADKNGSQSQKATCVSAVCRICLARNVEYLMERKIFMLFDPCLSWHSIYQPTKCTQ